MTDRIAFVLAGIILALLALDLLANSGEVSLFLARKTVDLSDYLMFWR